MDIKTLRESSGMSRIQFAEYFGIPYRTLQKWELGERECAPYLIALICYKLEKEGLFHVSNPRPRDGERQSASPAPAADTSE